MMTVLDLFSGIGGFSLGLERSGGFRTVAFCEIDPFCRRVLAKHWPGVPILEDVTTTNFPDADVIVGGFPCQDVSLAGKRAGVTAERSGLYKELVRAVRMVRPRYAILENVAALLSDGMGTVLGDLAEVGDCIEWDCVPACAVVAPHERDRVWIVAHTQGLPQRESTDETDSVADSWEARVESAGLSQFASASHASDASSEQVGLARQPRIDGSPECRFADTASIRCGQGRTRRPPDSFARIRDEARRNSADPYGARLAFREGFSRDAWEELAPAERDVGGDERQSIWPDEPALSGVDDGIPDWMDRVRATGNSLLPQIPELIGRAILAAERNAP